MLDPQPPSHQQQHAARVLIQPGWRNSGPDHWQSHWQRRLGARAERIEQADWQHPRRPDWLATIQSALARTPGAILIAHSIGSIVAAGCHADAHAALPAVAVLVAPADVEREGAQPELRDFVPIPASPLGFPALLIASSSDPYCTLDRARSFARAWGADFRDIGDAGHINTDAGFGPWPEGWALVSAWLAAHGLSLEVERDSAEQQRRRA